MCSSVGDRTCLLPGFPIRKSSDQSSVDSSPRLIAASYVLHRLLVPRHPPCALNNLATQKTAHPPPEGNECAGLHKLLLQSQKMLASTVQFSTYDRCPTPPRRRPAHPHGGSGGTTEDRPRNEAAAPTRYPGRARSLRTQQRAYDRATPDHPRSTPACAGR